KLADTGGPDLDEVLSRVEPAEDLVPADLMISAVAEDATRKEDALRRADQTITPEALLASNTSSILISTLASPPTPPSLAIAMLGVNHPLGPRGLAALIGLDGCVAIMEVLRGGVGDERYATCPMLKELVTAGRLGRKSGAGFYIY